MPTVSPRPQPSARPTVTDADLAGLVRNGSEPAFDLLYARHGAAVRRLVAGMLRGAPETEDVVQDVFTRAFVHLRTRDEHPDDLRPWLYRVARNRVIDTVRMRRPSAEAREASAAGAAPDVVADLRQRPDDTVAAVRALPEPQRRALVLHAVDGRSYAEVARMLDVTPVAAKGLAFRGRERLRRGLDAAQAA